MVMSEPSNININSFFKVHRHLFSGLHWRYVCWLCQVYETCWPLVVHSLGAVIERHQMYDVHEVYARSSCSIPVVFLLPCLSPDDQPAGLSSMPGLHGQMDMIVLHISLLTYRNTELSNYRPIVWILLSSDLRFQCIECICWTTASKESCCSSWQRFCFVE